jgi:adenylate kinase family enzyme
MQRIMIIGGPGSGKSTLARALGAHFGLPVYHMDRDVHWLPGWEERAKAEKTPLVERIVALDAWVFEGGHSETYALRASHADLMIWLDLPMPLRLFRVIRRSLRDRGQTRADLADNCPERLRMLPEFIGYIVRTRKTSRAKKQRVFDGAPCEKLRFASAHEVNSYLKALS